MSGGAVLGRVDRREHRPGWLLRLFFGGMLVLTGCGGGGSSQPTDPTAGVSVLSQNLVPLSGGRCHVVGEVLNTSLRATLNITMTWQALDSNGNQLGQTAVTINDVPPGATRPYDATSIISSDALIRCSQIASLNRIQTTFTES